MLAVGPLELLLIGTFFLWVCTWALYRSTRRRLLAAEERQHAALGDIRKVVDSQLAELRAHGAAVISLAERFDGLTRRWDIEATHRALAAAHSSPASSGEPAEAATVIPLTVAESRLARRLRGATATPQVAQSVSR